MFEGLASKARVLVDQLAHGGKVGVPEVRIQIVCRGPSLVDVYPSRHDGISDEDVGVAAWLLGASRLLEGQAGGDQLVADRGLHVDPAGDHNHGVDASQDGTWSLDAERHVEGKAAIVALWTREMDRYLAVVQLVASGLATAGADTGTGRGYIHEYNRRADGTPTMLVAYYDDWYRRAGDDWLFTRRRLTRLYQGPPDLSGHFENTRPT
jgi:hypothetical protein